jgi:5-(carboxyamino)imidazole ribonucleotide synthase
MRKKLTQLGIPCPKFASVRNEQDIIKFFDVTQAQELVLKLPTGGYDGKGVARIKTASDNPIQEWLNLCDELLLEEMVNFKYEVSAVVARSSKGEVQAYEVVQTNQVDGVCKTVIAPAPELSAEVAAKATEIAVQIASELDVVGILAVEMFYVVPEVNGQVGASETFLVNELAMRPHNTGHWTIDGAVTSQFENHIRAVLGLKLGDTSRLNNQHFTVMQNILGSKRRQLSEALEAALAHNPQARINLYGKEIREGRKLGHINISGPDLGELLEDSKWIAELFEGKR